ncbi:MAG: SRPBCC family protein [Labilithrix sp.]|nr:SRPBCC family protein [Labilithrix sp.]
MVARRESEPTSKNETTIERKTDRELVVTRTIAGPARLVFEAWSKPELFMRWWVPKSVPIHVISCEMDVRTGGTYRLVFGMEGREPMAFFGKYLEVTPPSRIVWTNDEGGEGTGAVTTVTFEERDGKTLIVMHELFPSKDALDEELASGSKDGMAETFDQLDEVIATLSGQARPGDRSARTP